MELVNSEDAVDFEDRGADFFEGDIRRNALEQDEGCAADCETGVRNEVLC